MAVYKQEIERSAKGSLMEREDWWRLCYDTVAEVFYIEHEWDHVNAYDLTAKANVGTARIELEGYNGPGTEKIEEAQRALLEKANSEG